MWSQQFNTRSTADGISAKKLISVLALWCLASAVALWLWILVLVNSSLAEISDDKTSRH